ncbi:MAG: YiiX/YebB-like N1pC/P60 family cysteine hydrolase [Kiritimatiellia bacterium]|jgi:phosphatidylglycerophosphate synthase|nr:YiiX/YebB-like N1pC/P60 family cysteine hydrolase [Kiritimatiellia bacterium]MDP6629754.1 YiiX/YebB-like N1pC/P60 family cysteine hydrolase [Kiritimatiellia bacterium]MDP6811030.1 YiiX/YebB-like N1pC/P60 family cysteine hydrolase [Kiritimatiellia bacterium]MDP7023115.1 YiiX/YebB-like N1pC/P60 family cysteine hydrolase [Kiritimatiellia bacterium]
MTEQFQGDKKKGQSLLYGVETKFKNWLLPMVPERVETYHLTLTTVAWSLLLIFFAFLARTDIRWLWGASFMIVLQYVTDLLDGAIGRQRDTGLIKWGYYMDHLLDYLFLCAILIGYALLVQDQHKFMLFFILALFGAFMVNSFLAFAATNEFQISYMGIGPTEIRLVFIAINTVIILLHGNTHLEAALPYVLWFSLFGLFVTVYRTQEHIWDLDMKNKYGEEAMLKARTRDRSVLEQKWTLYLSWRKVVRNLVLSFLIAFVALTVLMMRVAAPYHRLLAGALYLASWIPFVRSFKDRLALLRRRGRQVKGIIRPHLPYVLVGLALIVAAYVAHALAPIHDSQLISMTEKDLKDELQTDLHNLEVLSGSMGSLIGWTQSEGLLSRPVNDLSAEDKQNVRDAWLQFADLSLELDILKSKYKGFYQVDQLSRRTLHAEAFFVQFAAFVTQYRTTLKLVSAVEESDFMNTLLDEPLSAHGIPANSYSAIKQRLTNPQVMIRLNAWACYFPLIRKDVSQRQDLVDRVAGSIEDIYLTIGKKPSILVSNPRDLFEKRAFAAWFPFQREIALHMGRVRVETHSYRIRPEHISELLPPLQPGDIIFERRNWKMSNAGIPGFWPHVALHVGTPAEFDAFFTSLPMLDNQSPMEYIRQNFAHVHAAMSTQDANGYEHAIIEALEPGIIFTSREESLHADYVGIIRPRLTKEQIFKALLNAFEHHGKPYDFNFDFATDTKLVCSELVYKAFGDMQGITLKPATLNGRLLMKPNFLAEKFDREYGTNRQEFDFVCFLDSSEKTGEVMLRDAAAFAESWKRPKWDILMD